jgi:uncharacterized protein YjbJ (UPF0337 family)
MSEKAKGKAKEAYGALAGDEGKKTEGQAQQRKESAREEREQQKRTKAEQNKADRAEKSRDKQQRKDKGGLLNLLDQTRTTNRTGVYAIPVLLYALIYRSVWKVNSRKPVWIEPCYPCSGGPGGPTTSVP